MFYRKKTITLCVPAVNMLPFCTIRISHAKGYQRKGVTVCVSVLLMKTYPAEILRANLLY